MKIKHEKEMSGGISLTPFALEGVRGDDDNDDDILGMNERITDRHIIGRIKKLRQQ